MIPKLKILFFLVMLLMGKALHAQDLDARSPQPAPVGKQHLKNQSKNTRKMMRKSHHSSKRWNEDRKGFFLTRWMKKKNH